MRSFDVGRYGLWLLRALWLALPLVAATTLDNTLDSLERPLGAEVPMWVLWFLGLVATLVPSPIGLTAMRMLVPALVVWPLLVGLLDDFTSSLGIAAAYGAVISVVTFNAAIGDRMINGSAYGSERRMALRAPGFVLFGPLPGTWLALLAATSGLWLAVLAGRWLLCAVMAVVAATTTGLAWRILHQLSRRWLVFVPAGFVIHDRLMALDSILLQRAIVASLGPATAENLDLASDLSGRAPGLALEVVLTETVAFSRRQQGEVRTTEADRIVFTPTLPGAVLREARIRAITVGAT